MNGAERLVRSAIDAGIDLCFANPGTTELPLVVAMDSVPGIRSVLGLFEGVCTGAADGYGRMSGKPAMALLHMGPGLANGIANLHNAKRGRTPIVAVVGEHATWHRALDPPLAMDIEAMAGTVSGWQRTCNSSDLIGQDMVDAVLAACQGQVATLIVPFDLQGKPASPVQILPRTSRKGSVAAEAVKSAEVLLMKGERSALVLGGDALGQDGLTAAARIRQACGCDLLVEGFPARIERGAGLPDPKRIPYLPEAAINMLSGYNSFVFVGVGEPVAFFGYEGGPGPLLNEGQKRCLLADHGHDGIEALSLLSEALGAYETLPAADPWPDRPSLPTGSLTGDKACTVIAALQPEGAIVVDEAVTSGRRYYSLTAGTPPCSLLTLTGGSLGQGPPCAVGAAIACPDRPVIDLQADGAFLYTIQALWTQAREGLNITTVLFSNRTYRILRSEMQRLGVAVPGPNALRLVDLEGIDWVAIGRGMGVPSSRVATAEELAREFEKSLLEPGPHLIEAVLSI